MSGRLPRIRKVLSYSKGHGGDLERAMDALGPNADSSEELRKIFILGVTAHLAGFSTLRDSAGKQHLIKYVEQHPAARQLAQEILAVGGGYQVTPNDGYAPRPAAKVHGSLDTTVPVSDSSHEPVEGGAAKPHGLPKQSAESSVSTGGGGTGANAEAIQSVTPAQASAPTERATPRVDSSAEDQSPAESEAQRPTRSAQFEATDVAGMSERQKNLSNDRLVQQKVDRNQPEIAAEKTVSNLTVGQAGLTNDVTAHHDKLAAAANDGVEQPVDDEASKSAQKLMQRAMADF